MIQISLLFDFQIFIIKIRLTRVQRALIQGGVDTELASEHSQLLEVSTILFMYIYILDTYLPPPPLVKKLGFFLVMVF